MQAPSGIPASTRPRLCDRKCEDAPSSRLQARPSSTSRFLRTINVKARRNSGPFASGPDELDAAGQPPTTRSVSSPRIGCSLVPFPAHQQRGVRPVTQAGLGVDAPVTQARPQPPRPVQVPFLLRIIRHLSLCRRRRRWLADGHRDTAATGAWPEHRNAVRAAPRRACPR